jgi:hypothetical protein
VILAFEQMDLHLLWANDGRLFIKPLSRFLLNPEFWSKKLHQNVVVKGPCRPFFSSKP